MSAIESLRVRIFADGADLAGITEMAARPYIAGFTTNPTLMRKAGVADYRAFARDVLRAAADKPVSFEVFADEFAEMQWQAEEIASWGRNVFVKIPVTNTRGESSAKLIRRLALAGVKQNVTAVMTLNQVREVSIALGTRSESFISIFAGRIADTGRDPAPIIRSAAEFIRPFSNQQLIWASPREVLNLFQADVAGCHVITVTHDLLKKLDLLGKDLDEYSLETVRMFYDDARRAGYTLPGKGRVAA
jgi:transaldolase